MAEVQFEVAPSVALVQSAASPAKVVLSAMVLPLAIENPTRV